MIRRSAMAGALLGLWALAQTPQPAERPQAPQPASPPTPAAPATPAPKPALHYSGKPLVLDSQCTEEDMAWAGLSCSEDDPCPVYAEIDAVEPVANRIFAIGNLHSRSTTLYSILLASDDAGKTWREVYDRMRGTGLEHIQFIDFETGWISGGTVHPLPQEPFLLITSDGGQSWRRRPILSESKPGSVVQFWFTSRDQGTLLIDREQTGDGGRYELYETPNGGETWMIREASDRQPKIRRGPGNTDWRVRADGATKSFRIERRQGERWLTVSAFSIPAGVCKAASPVEAAPPVETPPGEPEQRAAPLPRRAPPTLKKTPR